jgi:hypothetical protein
MLSCSQDRVTCNYDNVIHVNMKGVSWYHDNVPCSHDRVITLSHYHVIMTGLACYHDTML